jgi:hypothetical protein
MACPSTQSATKSPNWTLPPDGLGELWDQRALKSARGGECGCAGDRGGSCACEGGCSGGCGGSGKCSGASHASSVTSAGVIVADYDGELMPKNYLRWPDKMSIDTRPALRKSSESDMGGPRTSNASSSITSGSMQSCNVPGHGVMWGWIRPGNIICFDPPHYQECLPCSAPPPPPPPIETCPWDCIAAALAILDCSTWLSGISDPETYNYLRAECQAQLDLYNAICRSLFPDCPTLEVPPPMPVKQCGGDVTRKMLDEMKKAIKNCASGAVQALKEYKRRFTSDLNWKVTPPKDADCSQGCPQTLCICSKCMNDSVPANIMYGFATATCGLPLIIVKGIAFRAALEGKVGATDPRWRSDISRGEAYRRYDEIWPPHDQKAVELGYLLGTNGTTDMNTFCAMFNLMMGELQAPDDPQCKSAPCCS